MNNMLWDEYSHVDEDNAKAVKNILESFNAIIDGLLILTDRNYIFNNINCTEYTKEFYDKFGDFDKLSIKIEALRNMIFGDALDWNEISRSLE